MSTTANGSSVLVDGDWKSVGNIMVYTEGSWRQINKKYVYQDNQWKSITILGEE